MTSARREQIKRHLEALKAISRETDECKRAVEVKKIKNKEDLSEINKWNEEIDEKLNKADFEISRLEGWLNRRKGKTREIYRARGTAEIRTEATRNKVEITSGIGNKCNARIVQYDYNYDVRENREASKIGDLKIRMDPILIGPDFLDSFPKS